MIKVSNPDTTSGLPKWGKWNAQERSIFSEIVTEIYDFNSDKDDNLATSSHLRESQRANLEHESMANIRTFCSRR